ncbi:hypothetical protein BDY19DRAFT_586245 [Irpex rosettiformis]|uniref:Uncharacterized protein n=1 Tax=Irpex rosettiformis TaxID=378272 RepID=A0ACB8UD64_9APHY|nr:hypothetical protein BDY19DRAFT_586245 [Irpex rosettiformis]
MSNTTVDPSYIPLPVPGTPIWNTLYEDYSSGLIGSWITILLCGIALAQTYHYFNNYPTDSLRLKMLVWTLMILNVLHATFVCVAEYQYLVSGIGDRTASLTIGWAIVVTVEIHVTLAAAVLLYFTNMCTKMLAGKRVQKPLLVILLIIIALHFGFGTATVVELARLNTLWDFESFKNVSTIPMVAFQVAADVSVAASVCYALPRPSRQSFRQSREAIQTLVVYAVSRGILTSFAAIVELVGLTIGSQGLWFAAADYIIAGLYMNSFLASLNSRNRIRQRMAGVVNVDSQLPASINHSRLLLKR